MRFCRLLCAIGLAPVMRPDDHELSRAIRHARAASWQHGKIASNAQTASLDRIEENVSDPRIHELKKGSENLKATISEMLRKIR